MLRSILTLLIIAIGITCLVGILTAIDSLLLSMNDSFNRIGANSYSIVPGKEALQTRRRGRRKQTAPPITYKQAQKYKDKFDGLVSISRRCTGSAQATFMDKKTNPTVTVIGMDEKHLKISSLELATGRNFTGKEVNNAKHVAIIGDEIVKTLFNEKSEDALGKLIKVDNIKYKVVGVTESKGNAFGGSGDRKVYIPVTSAKQYYGSSQSNYSITNGLSNALNLDESMDRSIGIMRNIRKIGIGEDNDFRIQKSDGMLNQLKDMTSQVRYATIAIAFITLLGAAIGLMNIMLVTVTERTKEIGIRKAIGAPSSSILSQFLIEAVMICLIGGLVGIVLGVGLGNIVAVLVKGKFIMPWNWMLLGVTVCVVVGVLSGLYPAYKASRMDPIESLRYE